MYLPHTAIRDAVDNWAKAAKVAYQSRVSKASSETAGVSSHTYVGSVTGDAYDITIPLLRTIRETVRKSWKFLFVLDPPYGFKV